MKTLIVIDMQNDFITGPLGSPEAQKIVPKVATKVQEYHSRGDRVIFTKDTHHANYLSTNEGKHLRVPHCIQHTDGWMIHDDVFIYGCDVINKPTFGWLNWDEQYRFSDDIEIIGLCTDVCVVSNALILKAMNPEIEITVDASCCAGISPKTHAAALLTMKMCHINVINE